MEVKPTIICINETFFDESIKDVMLEGYVLIGRRDRQDVRKCGGVAVFALALQADQITLVHKSASSERIWVIIHSDLGPYLIGAWYRPPVQGETATINSLREEWLELSRGVMGTIIVGDMNIHHKKWLWRSSRNSAEGDELLRFCTDAGLQQLVREPTRDQYLLDLVLSDVVAMKCKVLPKIADHCLVHSHFNITVPKTDIKERLVWNYSQADWEGVRSRVENADCENLVRTADAGAEDIAREAL
jgi:hypothetical protein